MELNKPDIDQLLFWCQYWFVLISCQPNEPAFLYLILLSVFKLKVCFFFGGWSVCRILVAALTVFERVGDNFISWYGSLNWFDVSSFEALPNIWHAESYLFKLKDTNVQRSEIGILCVSLVSQNKGINPSDCFIVCYPVNNWLRSICICGQGTTYVYETFFRPYVAKHENEIDRNLLELRTRAGDIMVLYFQKVASYGQTRIFEILQYVASQSHSQSSRTRPVQVLFFRL